VIKFNPNCVMRVYAKSSTYTAGTGHTTTWTDAGLLHGEWRGTYGDRVTAVQSLGVSDSATIRAYFHPLIYEKLRTTQCVIIKGDDKTALVGGVPNKGNPNCYELWGGIDNYYEVDQFIEFTVRRYEEK
jgi:hypothetical protein